MSIRTDERWLQLSDIGRLTFILAATIMDDNWGAGAASVSELVAAAWPVDQDAADCGDDEAQGRIDEARRQVGLMVELGLLLSHKTEHGRCIAYGPAWDRHQGWRRKRGAPTIPMSREVCSMRDWTAIGPNSITALRDWADRYGVSDVVFDHDGQPVDWFSRRKASCTNVPELFRNKTGTSADLGPQMFHERGCLEVELEGEGEGELEVEAEVAPPPPHVHETQLPKAATDTLAECGITPSQALRKVKHLQHIADASCKGDLAVLAVAYAVKAVTRRDKHQKDAGVVWTCSARDGDAVSASDVRKALKLLGRAEKAATRVLRAARRCSACGGDLGSTKTCESCRIARDEGVTS